MPAEPLRLSDVRRISTFRLTVILGALFAVGVIALLGLVYALTVNELTARNDGIMRDQARRWQAGPAATLPGRIAGDLRGHRFNYGALFSHSGERIVGNLGWVAGLKPGHAIERDATADHVALRIIALRTADGETLLVGRDITQIRDLRQRILIILLASGLAITLGVALGAVAFSLEPLRRVRDLQQSARQIVAGRLDVRMPISGRHDELDQFATTVNLMVEDVTRLIEQVKGVTDAIAHDLRTPLTRVRAQLHRARGVTDADALAPLLASAEENLEAALDRFAALLRISEIEAGARRAGFAATDPARLLRQIADLYEPLAEESGIRLTIDIAETPAIFADSALLFEAIGNLLDNAIKFAASAVSIRVAPHGDGIVLEIRDDGSGIPADQQRAVLQRFHRSPDAAAYPGNGLGLSIVAAILHLHRFEWTLENAAPGLRVAVVVPPDGIMPETG